MTLFNPGASATGTYDQPVGVNSSRFATLINANWSNAVIEYTYNGTPVNGWIESGNSNRSTDTLLWLRLDSIPAHGGTNLSIYFGPKTWFNLSADGYLGENPLLSPTYGADDNGGRVFDEYANFSGTALPADWTPLGSWAGTVHDGLTVAAASQMGAIEAPLASPETSNLLVETSTSMNTAGAALYLFLAATPGFSSQYEFFPSAYALDAGLSSSSAIGIETSNSTGAGAFRGPSVSAPVDFAQASHVLSLGWRSANSTESASVNYYPLLSQVNATNAPIADLGLGAYCNTNCSSWNVSWVRARNAPDPMPLVSDQAFVPFGVLASGTPRETDTDHAVAFTCNASAPAVTFDWTFGDGQSAAGRTTVHTFARPGTFVALCSVTDLDGGVGSATAPEVVNPPPAILLFQAGPSVFPLGSSLNLVANLSGGTPPFTYSYVGLPPGCPDRDTSTLSCLPDEAGTFAIEFIVWDAVGETTSAWITITVTPTSAASGGTPLTPVEGYALAGGVAGLVVLAGVLPVLLWKRRPPVPAESGAETPPAAPGARQDQARRVS